MMKDYYIDCSFKSREGLCFTDRKVELEKLLKLCEKGYHTPIVVYGPEGCGKTTLLNYLRHILSRSKEFVVVYVDALQESVQEALKIVPEIDRREIMKMLESLARMDIREILVRVYDIVHILITKLKLSKKKLVILIDDVYKCLGLENVDKYTKMLYELIGWKFRRELMLDSVLVLLTTSEGVSKRELLKHTYVNVYMLWNMSHNGFKLLYEQLRPEISFEDAWILTGGNPRALLELYEDNWDVDKYVRRILQKVSVIIEDLPKDRLRRLVEDPDSDVELARVLEDRGLMIRLLRGELCLSEEPSPDRELGIGEKWAWKIPAYRLAIEKLCR